MTRARIAAAVAGVITVLLVQATLVGPVVPAWAVSLPAVLVAAVALTDGPGTGMSLGFATGLAADLASRHPAGILALCWLGVGLLTGLVGDRRRALPNAATVGLVCASGAGAAALLLDVTSSGGTALDAVTGFVPVASISALLALAVVPLVRRMLLTEYLRAPHPVYTELVLEPHRGR